MLKQAAWHQRWHESQPMEKPSSPEYPQMQEIDSELFESALGSTVADCLRLAGMVDGEGEGKAELSPSKPSAASVASLGIS